MCIPARTAIQISGESLRRKSPPELTSTTRSWLSLSGQQISYIIISIYYTLVSVCCCNNPRPDDEHDGSCSSPCSPPPLWSFSHTRQQRSVVVVVTTSSSSSRHLLVPALQWRHELLQWQADLPTLAALAAAPIRSPLIIFDNETVHVFSACKWVLESSCGVGSCGISEFLSLSLRMIGVLCSFGYHRRYW